jgi:hypothetical protein
MVSQENIKNWSRSVQKWEGNKWRKHGLVWECSTLGLSLFMLPMGAIELWIQILYGFLLYTIPCGVIRQFTHPKYLFITLSVTRYTMLRDFNLHSNRCDVNKASLSFHLKSTKSNFVQQSRIKINMDSTRILFGNPRPFHASLQRHHFDFSVVSFCNYKNYLCKKFNNYFQIILSH